MTPTPDLYSRSEPAPSYDRVPCVGDDTFGVLSDVLGLDRDSLTELSAAGVISREET